MKRKARSYCNLGAILVVSCMILAAGSAGAVGGVATDLANLTVNGVFTDNAVIQRGMPVPVFGTAADGTVVTVAFNSQNVQATAAGGKWQATLAAMAANTSPGNMVISGGGTTITLTGLLVGEIWVLSGQSNMVKELSSVYEGQETAADAPQHNIRLFKEASGGTPTGIVWTAADADTAGVFSAVGYFFAHHLAHNMNPVVPIGLIQAATVGTTIQEWCHYDGAAGGCYDTQVKPLQPYAIRGVLWYQGESNTGDMDYYDHLVALMDEWRTDWGQGFFPFFLVQLHGSVNWATLREQQLQAWLTGPDTGMAVAVDLPPAGSMHPLTKRPIGDRLALFARALCYGETSLEYSGPLRDPAHSYVQGNQMVIAFTHLGGGLTTGSAYQPGGAPYPFALAGGDGRYFPATAQIVGNTVLVTSASVPNPVSVRYIWDIDKGNLYNTNDLPASPFEMTPTGSPPGGDTQVPTAPTNLSATAISASQINLNWTASTDNVGVTGYKIFRGSVEVDTATGTTYQDTGLFANTTYSYYIKAFDAAGNISAQSNTASATTQNGGGSTVMHVAEIWTCDAGGNAKGAFVRPETVYWKVKIVDAGGNPISGVTVTTKIYRPGSSSVWTTKSAMTDAAGIATMNIGLVNKSATGTYTIKVSSVTKSSWIYDPAANVKSETTFLVQ